jgi:hypothetical protein
MGQHKNFKFRNLLAWEYDYLSATDFYSDNVMNKHCNNSAAVNSLRKVSKHQPKHESDVTGNLTSQK